MSEIMYILYKYKCHGCDYHGDDGYCDSSCDYKWDVLDKIKELENKYIFKIVNDLRESPLNASNIESHENYMMKLLEKWEEKLK